jgi:alanine-glyoxylate transaminase/serine-glyoxylate transaminase/serine-pyruvate transaminase
VQAWGLEVWCEEPKEYSSSLTAVAMPLGHDADKLRQIILDAFDMSLGTGLAKLGGKVFRIGHLGHFNHLMLTGTLSGVEMGLKLAKVPYKPGGINAALEHLVASHQRAAVEAQVAEAALR